MDLGALGVGVGVWRGKSLCCTELRLFAHHRIHQLRGRVFTIQAKRLLRFRLTELIRLLRLVEIKKGHVCVSSRNLLLDEEEGSRGAERS